MKKSSVVFHIGLFLTATIAYYLNFTYFPLFISILFIIELLSSPQKKLIDPFHSLTRPGQVQIKNKNSVKTVDADDISVGDIIRVSSGSIIPFDGIVEVGSGKVDESILFGSDNRKITRLDNLFAYTKLRSGMVFLKVTSLDTQATGIHNHARLLAEKNSFHKSFSQQINYMSFVSIFILALLSVILYFSTASTIFSLLLITSFLSLSAIPGIQSLLSRQLNSIKDYLLSHQIVPYDLDAVASLSSCPPLHLPSDLLLNNIKISSIHNRGLFNDAVLVKHILSVLEDVRHPLRFVVRDLHDSLQVESIQFTSLEKEALGVTAEVGTHLIHVGTLEWLKSKNVGLYDAGIVVQSAREDNLACLVIVVDMRFAGAILYSFNFEAHNSIFPIVASKGIDENRDFFLSKQTKIINKPIVHSYFSTSPPIFLTSHFNAIKKNAIFLPEFFPSLNYLYSSAKVLKRISIFVYLSTILRAIMFAITILALKMYPSMLIVIVAMVLSYFVDQFLLQLNRHALK